MNKISREEMIKKRFAVPLTPPGAHVGCGVKTEAAIKRACKIYGVSKEDILAPTRGNVKVCEARNWVYADLYRSGMSFSRIGDALGRDHGSVIHGVKVFLSDLMDQVTDGMGCGNA